MHYARLYFLFEDYEKRSNNKKGTYQPIFRKSNQKGHKIVTTQTITKHAEQSHSK